MQNILRMTQSWEDLSIWEAFWTFLFASSLLTVFVSSFLPSQLCRYISLVAILQTQSFISNHFWWQPNQTINGPFKSQQTQTCPKRKQTNSEDEIFMFAGEIFIKLLYPSSLTCIYHSKHFLPRQNIYTGDGGEV